MTLKLTSPRGLLDGYTVPAWPSDVAGIAPGPGGQIVTALAPGGALVTAGIRRGDVIRAIGGRAVDTPGAMTAALRALPAGAPVQVDYDRAGVRTAAVVTPKPDWTRVSDYGPAFNVILRRAPGVLALQYAAARQRIDAGKPAEARTQLGSWSAVDRGSAPGQMLSAALLAAQGKPKQALAAYNRALAADPQLGSAQFGRGVSLSAMGRFADAAAAFGEAARLDPADASSLAFRAYSLLRLDQDAGALKAATQAVVLDPAYEEAHLARGLTLLALGRVPQGVSELKRGLLLTSDPKRAQQIITANLEPATP
jgi:tetratricopeptide (TPR) repeat protein